MKVLLLSASYQPVLGGLQTVVHNLARGLISRGHMALAVTNRYPRHLPELETMDGVPLRRWLFLQPRSEDLRRGRPDLFLSSLYYYPATSFRLARLARDLRPDVVNIHFPDGQMRFLMRLRKRVSFRLVVSLHGDEVERCLLSGCNGRLPGLLMEADAVTACSHHLLSRAALIEPSVVSKGSVIHNGITPEIFEDRTPYRHPRAYVLAYGRLVHKKGFDLLLEAFADVASRRGDTDLIIAGTGEEEPSLRRMCGELGIADRVLFFGGATPPEVVRLLNGCRLVVVPSREEPYGIVAIEALAAGKPVLATRVGGVPEILGACPGILVEPTRTGLAEGLRQHFSGATSAAQLAPARASVRSWQQVIQDYLNVYDLESLGDVGSLAS